MSNADEDIHPASSSKMQMSPEHREKGSKRRKRRKRRPKDVFSIPGVVKIVLSELAQKIIGCVAGVDVTTENPWTLVEKEAVLDNLELHEESSEFLPIRKELISFPRPKLLIGYVPDESRDYDEFYICVTEKATDDVTEIIEKMRKSQEERLNNAVYKTVREWKPQGTEEEVNEAIMRNNRALLEVEIESKYPIFPEKVQFRTVPAQQRRDGYMELRSTDETFANIYKRRIDAGVQVAPRCLSTQAQTNCTYPSNTASQYLYEVQENKQLVEQCKASIVGYADAHMQDLSDTLTVNGVLDLYSDDYSSLVTDHMLSWSQSVALDHIKDYMSFMDVLLCKGKKIASVDWHPMWTGIVAIAYADASPNDFACGPSTEDSVLKAIHGVNPVLIWSTQDALKAKLLLESPREVHKISFCPFDENLLVGGCKDGQIIIWDIRNRLHKVEELEILTTSQQKHRSYMNSLMGWMKDVHDLALVRPTAITDARYCHKGPVTGITWCSPFHEYSKIGNLTEIPEDADPPNSMQFLTCSEDGSVMIWDLLKRAKVEPGGFKVKKLKRLKKKPSALMADVSPYQTLHLTWKPIYKIYLRRPGEKTRNLAISSCFGIDSDCRVEYVPRSPIPKKTKLEDRLYFTPVFKRDCHRPVLPRISLGSNEGDYAVLTWDGQDFDSGEVVNSEVGVPFSFGKYHDGPVTALHASNSFDVTLTIGGRIFALWRDDFKDRPVLWRRCKNKITAGKFYLFQPYRLLILLISGYLETWKLATSSKYPVKSYMYSSEYLTSTAVHPRQLKKNLYGTGDRQGAFWLFLTPLESKESAAAKTAEFTAFIDREVARKKEFMEWQAEWGRRHVAWIQIKEDELRQRRDKEEAEKRAKAAELMGEKAQAKPAPKGPQPGKFVEWMMEQKELEREARIRSMIINKKQLDTKEMEKRRKPLQKLEAENELKKRKQKQRLKEGETIFHNTVAALFPEVVKEKPAPPPDPYAGGDLPHEIESCYCEYEELCEEAERFINSHPYKYRFDWRQVLEGGKVRRRHLDDSGSGTDARKSVRSRADKGQGSLSQGGVSEVASEEVVDAVDAS